MSYSKASKELVQLGYPEVVRVLGVYIYDRQEGDGLKEAKEYTLVSKKTAMQAIKELKLLLALPEGELPWESIVHTANINLLSEKEAREWLQKVLLVIEENLTDAKE